jgi:hypothetical protein
LTPSHVFVFTYKGDENVKDDEPNYFDQLNHIVDRIFAASGSRLDLVEALAFREGLETAYTAALIQRLLDLLEKRGILTQDDRLELKTSIKKTLDQQMKATAEKNPESPFAKGLAEAVKLHVEEREKQQKSSLIFSPYIWKYVDLDQISEDKKAGKRD